MAKGSFMASLSSLVRDFRKQEIPPMDPEERAAHKLAQYKADLMAALPKHPAFEIFMGEVLAIERELVEEMSGDLDQTRFLIVKAKLQTLVRVKNIPNDTIAAGKDADKMLNDKTEGLTEDDTDGR